jgi:hypothetical protein
VTANGTNTSAVIRGNWVLQNILGDSVLPPPSNVPAIEPDIRGATTLRQQLEAHRSQPNCASCHNKMDPLGFVLENFDPIGGWRTHYRSKAAGTRPRLKQAPFTFAFIKYRIGLPVDTKTQSSDGQPLQDIHALKRWLRSRDTDVQRCIARKLLTYGMGRSMRFSDRESIQAILDRVASKQGGLRTLVDEIVQSELFQSY